jgi:transcriptional regulator with XRE-family HTH domain
VPGKVSSKLKRETRTLGQAIGAVVTELRIGKRWSQGKLAAKAGYSTSWVNMLENGKINPTLELVIVFAGIFDLTLSQFFSRAERRHLKQQAAEPSSTELKKRRS